MVAMFNAMRCKIAARVRLLCADQRGNIAVMMAFLFPIIAGGLGLGFEASNWYLQTRAMQNAADSAAIAAATNGSSNYDVEAKAVAAQYGFVDGSNNVTVTASNTAACPAGGNTCYSVAITGKVPLYVAQVVGYSGDTTVNGAKAQTLSSTSVAQQTTIWQPICLLALDASGTALRTNGGPKADFTGCTVMSNGNATCNGSNLNATYGIAVGTNGGGAGCGNKQISGTTTPSIQPLTAPGCPTAQNPSGVCYDQILAKDSGMSATALAKCSGSYPQYAKKTGYPTKISALSKLLSFTDSNNNTVYVACGDTQLSGDVTAPAGSVLVVENGNLDLGGHTLSGSALNLVFSGTADTKSVTYGHAPTGSGTLDIQAPTSGTLSGVALYQDPNLTGTGVDVSYAGNNPTWNITGLVYMPNSSVTISGAINKSANGAGCMVQIAKDVLIDGTGLIYAQSPDGNGCKKAGLNQLTEAIPGRSKLVY
jgi:Flp pilus assembly protein TadG